MRFHVQATEPTAPADLKSTLEKSRDEWRATTEQEHPVGSEMHAQLEKSRASVDRQRTNNTDKDGGASLREAVESHAAVVKAHSVSPGPNMAGALALIDKGIAAAVAAAAGGNAVRATIAGHFHTKPKASLGLQGNLSRLSIVVDDASLE